MSIMTKLLKVQQEIGAVKKDSKNPHFKNTYFDINTLLETVNPVLHRHNLVLEQPIVGDTVMSRIWDLDGDGPVHSVQSEIQLPQISDPQKMGSAITYYRRYTLVSLLALPAEDDDGNRAAGHTGGGSKFSKPSSKPRKVTKAQAQKIRDAIASVNDKAIQDQLKIDFVASFGKPADVSKNDYAVAYDWITSEIGKRLGEPF